MISVSKSQPPVSPTLFYIVAALAALFSMTVLLGPIVLPLSDRGHAEVNDLAKVVMALVGGVCTLSVFVKAPAQDADLRIGDNKGRTGAISVSKRRRRRRSSRSRGRR